MDTWISNVIKIGGGFLVAVGLLVVRRLFAVLDEKRQWQVMARNSLIDAESLIRRSRRNDETIDLDLLSDLLDGVRKAQQNLTGRARKDTEDAILEIESDTGLAGTPEMAQRMYRLLPLSLPLSNAPLTNALQGQIMSVSRLGASLSLLRSTPDFTDRAADARSPDSEPPSEADDENPDEPEDEHE